MHEKLSQTQHLQNSNVNCFMVSMCQHGLIGSYDGSLSQSTINVKSRSPTEVQIRVDLLPNLFTLWAEFLIFQLQALMFQFFVDHELQAASTVGAV